MKDWRRKLDDFQIKFRMTLKLISNCHLNVMFTQEEKSKDFIFIQSCDLISARHLVIVLLFQEVNLNKIECQLCFTGRVRGLLPPKYPRGNR